MSFTKAIPDNFVRGLSEAGHQYEVVDLHKIYLPDIIRYAGISLAGIGMIIFLTGLFTIKTLES
jgi:hypothetical protein